MTKHFVLPDCQVKPGVPLDHLTWAGRYVSEKRPDVIVCIGDFADMSSLSSYDVGKKSFEGRSYKADIEAAAEGMRMFLDPIRELQAQQRRNKEKIYRPRLILTLGNHECYDLETEILTRSGWKFPKELTLDDYIYTLNRDGIGEWHKPTNIFFKEFKGKMWSYNSRTLSLRVTPNHRVLYTYAGDITKIKETLAKRVPKSCDIPVAASSNSLGVDMTEEQLRFNAVALTDSYHPSNSSVVFYQSEGKHLKIRKIVQDAGVTYTEKVRDRNISEICGKTLKTCKLSYEFYISKPEWCVDNNKRLPDWVFDLSPNQWEIFLETLVFCDGTLPTKAVNSLVFYGKKLLCEDLQRACLVHGYRATITEYRDNQFRVNITKAVTCRVENFLQEEEIETEETVWCLEVKNENFLTRRNNKPIICGNCRILRAINDDRKLEGLISISDLPYQDWEVYDFLEPVVVDGVCYSHYFSSGQLGRPCISARAILTKKHMSCFAGHQQGRDIAYSQRADGKNMTAIISGSFYLHHEEYLNPQTNAHWNGVWMLHDVQDGAFDEMPVSISYLRKKYG